MGGLLAQTLFGVGRGAAGAARKGAAEKRFRGRSALNARYSVSGLGRVASRVNCAFGAAAGAALDPNLPYESDM